VRLAAALLLCACSGLSREVFDAGPQDAGSPVDAGTFCDYQCNTALGCGTGTTCAPYKLHPVKLCQYACSSATQCPAAPAGQVAICRSGHCETECSGDSACSDAGQVCEPYIFHEISYCQYPCAKTTDCIGLAVGYEASCVDGYCRYGCVSDVACGDGGMVCAPYDLSPVKTCQSRCTSASTCADKVTYQAVCQ
jgi:hypothetical protein